jgi:hypothetical protein
MPLSPVKVHLLVPPALAALLVAAACRSELEAYPPAPPVPECVVHADCEGFDDLCRNVRCVPDDGEGEGAGGASPQRVTRTRGGVCREVNPVDCSDGDICTIDLCDPMTGTCSWEDAAHDNDMDGFKGPREGTKAGDPDSCGDDCDDTNPEAFPGNMEVCDGADNDCNGIVDDNAIFVPAGVEPVRVSGDIAPAGTGGLAWSGTSYAAAYYGTDDGFDIYRSMLAPTGDKISAEERLTAFNSDSAGGPVLWVGDRYGVLWQERPNGDYEIFFRLLDEAGATVVTGPVQVSDGFFGFSVNPDLGWTGTNFVAVWQDEREGTFDVYGQLIGIEGNLIGPDVRLTETTSFPNEAPVVAASSLSIGVAWAKGNASAHFIQFRTFDFELSPVSPIVELTDGLTEAVYPTVVWNENNFVISWFDRTASPAAIYAAVVAPDGSVVVGPRAISSPGGARSRYPSVKPLGDRLLFVYSDDRDNNVGYELYARMVDANLNPLGGEQRITSAPGDSVYPKAAFGPEGDVGILFRDDRTGEQHTWFTRLGCLAGN